MAEKCWCQPGQCKPINVDRVQIACPSAKLTEDDLKLLRCVFANGQEVAAEYDQETQAFSCCPSKGTPLECLLSVQTSTGKVVCDAGNCDKWWRCAASDLDKDTLAACRKNGVPVGEALLTKDEATHGGEGDLSPAEGAASVFKKLSFLDRWLAVWVLLAMGLGLILGNFVPGIQEAFSVAQVAGVSLPIAFGLWLMMFPVLAKVRYELLGTIMKSRGMTTQLVMSLVMNWLVGPMLMTGLAWATLPDLPEYRDGVILVGLARCIAMVLIWNHLACGDAELCAVLVAINSILQVLLYAPMAVFYLGVISGRTIQGMDITEMTREVAKSVALFLGVPLVAAIIFRYAMIAIGNQVTKRESKDGSGNGAEWFMAKVMPYVGPWALIALLYTIIALFAMQGKEVVNDIGNVARTGVPMLLYFSILWATTFATLWKMGSSYDRAVTQAFTTSSNNFELAIAIAVGTYGVTSKQALAATVGPLIEVPVLLALVYVALWVKPRVSWGRNGVPTI